MCGLIARFSRHSEERFEPWALLSRISHRGPDAAGIVAWHSHTTPEKLTAEGQVPLQHFLGHRRLSILDLSSKADQPFQSSDGRYHLVYNGEIYNFVELREELAGLGANFRTHSDTEVLIEAWRKWGSDCLDRLEGMFAFVLYDSATGRAFAARDPFGIKPLFVSHHGGAITFASEIAPLLDLLPTHAWNDRALAKSLRWGMNDGDRETVFQGVERVPPGTLVEIETATATVVQESRYFDLLAIKPREWDFEAARQALRDEFLGSVERHLRSDAPIGFALSGGIDSSAIVCAAHALGRRDITTFSYLPSDPRISERKWIDIVVDHVGADSNFIEPAASDALQNLPAVVRFQGESFASLSVYAQYEVYAKVAQSGVKVILSGQGADELLAGYISYYQMAVVSGFRSGNLRTAARRLWLLHEKFGQSYQSFLRWSARLLLPEGWSALLAQRHLGKIAPWLDTGAMASAGMADWSRLDTGAELPSSIREMLISSIENSLQALLRYDDRNSMAHSVESRVPFLTPRLARLCLSFPDRFFIDPRGVTKHIFREAMRGIVPDPILDRPDKIGFAPDTSMWLDAQRHLLSDAGNCDLAGMVRHRTLEAALTPPLDESFDRHLSWRATNLIALYSKFLAGSR